MSQINLVNACHTTSWRSILISSHHLSLGLPSGLLQLRSPYQDPVCTSPLPNSCYMPCPPHSSWFDHPNIWWVQIIKCLITSSSPLPPYIVPPYSFLSTLLPNTLSLRSSLTVGDQVSHPYKTKGKIIVPYIQTLIFFNSKLEDERFCTK
jgi:hypothetical protein